MNVISKGILTFELQIREKVLDDLSLGELAVEIAIEFLKLASNLGRSLLIRTHWIDHKLKGMRVVSDHLLWLSSTSRGNWSVSHT